MRAVAPYDPSRGVSTPRLTDLPEPEPAPDEVLVEVRATALNRVDLLQLRGRYPVPDGESTIPGLECAGTVVRVGAEGSRWAPGDRVMALLAGGGHAERVAVPEGQLMPLPSTLDYAHGAAIPEAGLTAWSHLCVEAGLREGETVLVSGATGGVGSFTVQVASELGARVFAGGRDAERLAVLPAGEPVVEDGSLSERIRDRTGGRGLDVVFDTIGGERLGDRLSLLAPGGRLVLVGLMGGAEARLDASLILRRELRILGALLRPRSRAQKAALVSGFEGFALRRLEDGRLRPLIARTFPFEEIEAAYEALRTGGHVGKVVVTL